MLAWSERYPEAKLINEVSQRIMYIFVYSISGRFIDWESGSVDFLSDDFVRILEFAATFGNAYADWEDPGRIKAHEGFASGKYLLHDTVVNDLTGMQMLDALFDGEAKYIGYPREDASSGIVITPRNSLAINANSQHKDGAFAFISYLLSDAYQVDSRDFDYSVIPIKRSGVEALVTLQTTEPEGGGPLTSWSYDDLSVEIYASRNRDYIDTFYDVIARADGLRQGDTNVTAIIREEAESFFAGQKSTREVAEIIQNRVQVMYVNENR
jgi:ABC-type glycerol-3-phosphate transport system substrate-binding protein